LLGVACIAITIIQYWRALGYLHRVTGATVSFSALRSFFFVVGVLCFISSPIEDKGISFALIPLIALSSFEMISDGAADQRDWRLE
jgi:hypothetical protein